MLDKKKLDNVFKKYKLTKHQMAIVHLLLTGINNKEIGKILNVPTTTVRGRVMEILKRYNVSSRSEFIYRTFCDYENGD